MFTLEKEMKTIIAENIKVIPWTVSKGTSQADIAVAYAYELPVKYRWVDVAVAYAVNGLLPVSPLEVRPFKYLSGLLLNILSLFYIYPEVSIQRLKDYICIDSADVNFNLEKLQRLNLIEQISKYKFRATDWKKTWGSINIISIELKLCDWQEAIKQAEYNLLFSDYSFVALDKDRILNPEEVCPYFKEKNIGFFMVDSRGHIEPLVFPIRNQKYDKKLYAWQRIKLLKDFAQKQRWMLIR